MPLAAALLGWSADESAWIRRVLAGLDEALDRGGLRRRSVARTPEAMGRFLAAEGRLAEAEVALEAAARTYAAVPVAIEPRVDLLHGLGWVRGKRGDLDGSLAALREAVAVFDASSARARAEDPLDTMLSPPLAMELARRLEEAQRWGL